MQTRILITVKTYPSLSPKYKELVCTAGIRENGSWVRIYPVPYRSLAFYSRYKKYQWIILNLKRNTSDPRPESYRPVDVDKIVLEDEIKPGNASWSIRRKFVLQNVRCNMAELIAEAKNPAIATSLAVFKPTKIHDFYWKEDVREWNPAKLQAAYQEHLFNDVQNALQIARKIPYKFYYSFEDEQGKKSEMMIEDWETGQLYWNVFDKKGCERAACEDVRKKYFDDFAKSKDLHFFLGTTKEHHFTSRNPFIIIGTFHPQHEHQTSLDL